MFRCTNQGCVRYFNKSGPLTEREIFVYGGKCYCAQCGQKVRTPRIDSAWWLVIPILILAVAAAIMVTWR